MVNKPEASEGYTLFDGARGKTSYIVDNNGQLIKTWNLETTANPNLLANGNLLAREGSVVYEADKDGSIVWEYTHPDFLHHDLLPMPNGNILLLSKRNKTAADAIAAGANPDYIPSDDLILEYDYIAELQPDKSQGGGAIVWEWHMWDHLIQDYDPEKPNYGAVAEHPELIDINFTLPRLAEQGRGYDLAHGNALDYNPELDQIMLSARDFSELWIIDHSTTTAHDDRAGRRAQRRQRRPGRRPALPLGQPPGLWRRRRRRPAAFLAASDPLDTGGTAQRGQYPGFQQRE